MATTTNTNPLWDLQAQYLPGTFQSATEIYNQGAPGYYPGQTVADLDPVKVQGLNLGVDAALGAQTDLANTYATQLGGIAGGTDAYTQQLANQAAGATNFGYGQAGTLGSARHANAASQAASNTIADRQLSALSQIPQAQQAATLPGQTLSQIGGQTQDYAQSLIDADKQKYDYQANQPYNWLNQYQSALAPGGFNPSTTTSQQASGLEQASGIVSLLGGIGGLFGGGGGLFGFAEGGDTTQAWQGPTPSHQWQMQDGRYQLAATPGGSQVGGYANGSSNTGYKPTAIGWNPESGQTQITSGGYASSEPATTQVVATDAAGNAAPYLGVDQYDSEGDDNFLSTSEFQAATDTINQALVDAGVPAGYNPTTDVLTPEQQTAVLNSPEAQLAQEDIYHNVQQIYGTDTGNNITSLVTGGLSSPNTLQGAGADLGALAGNLPIVNALGNIIPSDSSWGETLNYYTVPVFGDNTQAQVDAHEEATADEWGSVQQDDGSYDISAWFNDDPALAPVASSSNDDDSNSIFSGSSDWGGPSSAPSTPAPTSYDFGSSYYYAQGGMVKKDYGWGM